MKELIDKFKTEQALVTDLREIGNCTKHPIGVTLLCSGSFCVVPWKHYSNCPTITVTHIHVSTYDTRLYCLACNVCIHFVGLPQITLMLIIKTRVISLMLSCVRCTCGGSTVSSLTLKKQKSQR